MPNGGKEPRRPCWVGGRGTCFPCRSFTRLSTIGRGNCVFEETYFKSKELGDLLEKGRYSVSQNAGFHKASFVAMLFTYPSCREHSISRLSGPSSVSLDPPKDYVLLWFAFQDHPNGPQSTGVPPISTSPDSQAVSCPFKASRQQRSQVRPRAGRERDKPDTSEVATERLKPQAQICVAAPPMCVCVC